MSYNGYTTAEIGRRGQELYEQRIRPLVETQHKGLFLVLDVVSGEYEVDADDLLASERLLQRRPEALLYGVRVGYQTAYRLGRMGARR